MSDEPLSGQSNLWLADTLWRLGAVQFGDFTLGRTTVHSPIYVNLRLLIAHPTALQKAAQILLHEIQALQAMRHPQIDPFDLVCGVPFGGLVVAEAFVSGLSMPTWQGWLVTLYVAIFPSCLAQLFFVRAVDLIGPGRTGVFVNLVPVFSAILAVVLINEPFHVFHAVALALVIGGIWLAERGRAASGGKG